MASVRLLSVDRLLAQRIATALGEHVDFDVIHAAADAGFEGPGLVVIDHAALPADRSLAATIAETAQAAPGRSVILATDAMEAHQVLAAVRAGATDVFEREAGPADIAEVLTRVLNASLASQGRLAQMTLVLGADQQACAMAATDMAIAHAAAGTATLLVDCTLPTSIAEAYLDLKADYGLASAVADIDRMDASLLADALARHEPSGVSLLTFDGGTGAEPAGLSPADVVGLVQFLRASFGHVVLCAGSLRHGGLLRELASQARAVEVLCSQSISALEDTGRLLERVALDTASARRARLLVWEHDPRVLLDGRRMADALGIDAVLALPAERVALLNALNSGQPLLLSREVSPYSQALRRACGLQAPGNRSGAGGLPAVSGIVPGFDRMKRALLRQVERTS